MRRVEVAGAGKDRLPATHEAQSAVAAYRAIGRNAFASTDVASVRIGQTRFIEADDYHQVNVIQRHFGLFAPYGPMPLHVTEHAMQESALNAMLHSNVLSTSFVAIWHGCITLPGRQCIRCLDTSARAILSPSG